MVEGAGPFVVAVGLALQLPAGVVFEHVVVTPEWFEVVPLGASALSPGVAVVEITVVSGHPAADPDACWVLGFDLSFQRCGGSSSGGITDKNVTVFVGDRIVPIGV